MMKVQNENKADIKKKAPGKVKANLLKTNVYNGRTIM